MVEGSGSQCWTLARKDARLFLDRLSARVFWAPGMCTADTEN